MVTKSKTGASRSTARRGATDTEKKPRSRDRLETYRAKRHFDVTPEPAPKSSQKRERAENKSARVAAEAPASLAFVVQKHDARRLHYDVRLEIDGAMASWAVPKGPSYDPKVRRLAVQTEDHPMAYNEFEGRIPDGEYGAGDVLIWDRGTYETVPPGQQRAMLEKGHLHVRFAGEKLAGEWHILRTSGRGGDDGTGQSGKAQWLMFKARDATANPDYDVVAERPESVVSGHAATRGPRRASASSAGKSADALLAVVGGPMLATAAPSIPDDAEYLFEVKYDGYRILAAKAGDEVRLATRKGNDWTSRFRPIADAFAKLPVRECVVDGEACVVDDHGRPSFERLQRWLAGELKEAKIAYAVFDLLWLDGRDHRSEPIEIRRELLERLVSGNKGALSISRSVEGRVSDLLAAAKSAGLEGLVAKRKGSAYVAGRNGAWLKLRFDLTQDCAVAGYVPMTGTTNLVGALLLAVSDGQKLVYAGRVGTGFDTATRRDLARRLDAARLPHAAVEGAPRLREARWARPEMVCECRLTEWTREGVMRHPRFVGLREDKTPLECVREERTPLAAAPSETPEAAPKDAPASRAAPPASAPGPKLVNPSKVLFPRDGLTKRDVWDYYTAVAPVMVPHLAGRPLTLQRYPNGIDGQEWYQQNVPDKTPDFVRLVDAGPRHEDKKRIVCDNVETLQWLASLAALTIHTWSSHVPPEATSRAAIDRALGQPDWFVLDLDPGAGPWSHLVEVARAVRRLLDALHLQSFVKTSGKRGVHVTVPIAPGPSHEEATGFAEKLARAVSKVLPHVATVERMKAKRGGKLYVDFGQNGEGRTVVAPYAIRARDGAVVSTPITWDELDESLDPTRFTIRTVLGRLEKHGDLYAGVLTGGQKLPPV